MSRDFGSRIFLALGICLQWVGLLILRSGEYGCGSAVLNYSLQKSVIMRIIGGTAGGRLLKAPKGYAVRPTPDLVRQAVFNSLGARVSGARVLELFAGTGALSLECLSRGAVVPRQFDLILADPPYGEKNVSHRSTSFAQRLLDDAHLPSLLAPGGLFVLGHTKRDTLERPGNWEEIKILKHGDTVIRFLSQPSGGVVQ